LRNSSREGEAKKLAALKLREGNSREDGPRTKGHLGGAKKNFVECQAAGKKGGERGRRRS